MVSNSSNHITNQVSYGWCLIIQILNAPQTEGFNLNIYNQPQLITLSIALGVYYLSNMQSKEEKPAS